METPPIITSLSNPLVRLARSLRQRKARTASGLFLVEGLHHVGAALEAAWDIDALLYAPDLLTGEFAASLLDEADRVGVTLKPVSAKVMESLAAKENPQGILALVRQRNLQFDELQDFHCGVALVAPQDPGNVGTILRTIDAVDADALFLLDGGVDLYHPTLVRASMGTLFWKPVVRASFDEFLAWSKSQSKQTLIGTSSSAAQDYRDVHFLHPAALNLTKVDGNSWVLLLGSEQKGLSPEQLSACDLKVSIPMRGRVSSLNLSVAAGVLLYEYLA
ncbi:MAG: RNA methyltransferase [Anaerolineales bacterium]